jgi:branched-chain amino acid transport system ATP-binding protein
MPLLEVEGIDLRYGAVPALRGVSLTLEPGETLAVVGANGAGKSTLTLAVAGALTPSAGRIVFDGRPHAGATPETVARRGIALVPEGRRIFEGLTVEENLRLGFSSAPAARDAPERLAEIFAMFPILKERRRGLGTRLSGGEQQQLAIARALLSRPRLLILDEPSLGLAPLMVERVYAVLETLRRGGLAMLLVEQNPGRVGRIADRMLVLANGTVRLEGRAGALLRSPDLAAAYLSGGKRPAAAGGGA